MLLRHGAVLALGRTSFPQHMQQLKPTLELLFDNVSMTKASLTCRGVEKQRDRILTFVTWIVTTARGRSAKSFSGLPRISCRK
jgi:hypothetical protein